MRVFAFFAGLLVSAFAHPASLDTPAANTVTLGTASLTQVPNPNYRGRNGPRALAKIYRKYGVPFPKDLQLVITRLDDRDNGSAILTPQSNDLEYLFPILIGTPPQELHIDIDTGSSDLWVFSTEMPKGQINGQSTYDPNKSTTAEKMSGATWRISYGDGSSSSGVVYNDVVEVGNISFATQAVEAAKKVSPEFTNDSSNDGVFGLAFSGLNQVRPEPQLTFFDNLVPNLNESLFTVDLKSGEPGRLNFGYIDPNAYSGSIAYTPVNESTGFWAFETLGYTIGDGSLREQSTAGIADTGATLMLLPQELVDDYYSHVGGARYDSDNGGVTFRCGATVPDLTFHLAGDDSTGNTVTVPGDYIRYGKVYNTDGTESGRCFGGLQSSNGFGISIFGDVFLKSTFAVFDAKEPRLGFAEKAL
ncbi:aspartic proteinase [Immersiella caudata]|uniref:Aspartic proteinase n=1 Tax=Immersiella caudata TaxID=314043 RepID=A0AA39XCT2_9PEZI|nr:aspartic proteinase [Immersiella caudata]